MAISLRKVGASVLIAVSVLANLIMFYDKPFRDFSMNSPETAHARYELPTRSSDPPALKADLPVLFLSDMVKFQANASSVRARSWNAIPEVWDSKLKDDYRFCYKEAPFLGPYDYLSNSKNPCWYPSDKGPLMCVPYFYLAGFSKCGTSDLYARITAHPQIGSSSRKEKHWFDYKRYFPGEDDITSYSQRLSGDTREIKRQLDQEGSSNIICGDGTPTYVWDSSYWQCYQGNRGINQPRYTNADVIYRLNPEAKIILMMRDPVTRLYSRYLSMATRSTVSMEGKPGPETFHKLTTRAIELYTKCFAEWSHRQCAYNGTLYTQAEFRLQEGMYSVYLRDWLKVFPRKQLLILKFEEYAKNIPENLKKIFQFLDVAPVTNQQIDDILKRRIKNPGSKYHLGAMSAESEAALRAFYAPFNKELQELLGDPSFAWGYE